MSEGTGNVFKDVLNDSKSVKKDYLGEDYPYYKYIKEPSAIGMSSKGSLNVLGKDIDGLIEYVGLLVSGKSKASATGQPLGNKFFLKTGGKCIDTKTQQEVPRTIYISNVPSGNIPFVSSGTGVNFAEFKGLIPGTMSNLNAMNPMSMFQSFLEGSKPECQEITMETIDTYNNKSTESNFVTLVDIKNMDPCTFKDKTNPVSGQKCKESFDNIDENKNDYITTNEYKFTNSNILHQIYLASIGLISIYSLYRIMLKGGLIPKK